MDVGEATKLVEGALEFLDNMLGLLVGEEDFRFDISDILYDVVERYSEKLGRAVRVRAPFIGKYIEVDEVDTTTFLTGTITKLVAGGELWLILHLKRSGDDELTFLMCVKERRLGRRKIKERTLEVLGKVAGQYREFEASRENIEEAAKFLAELATHFPKVGECLRLLSRYRDRPAELISIARLYP